MTRGRS